MTQGRSLLASFVVAPAVALAAAGAAYAAGGAQATTTHTAASASWGAAMTTAGGTPHGTYTITWPIPLGPVYLDLVNTGTATLQTYTLTAVNTKPNGTAPPEIMFEACVGATWSATTSTCAGTVVLLGTTSGGSLSATPTAAPAAGARLSVRARPTSLLNFPQQFSTIVNISVTRAQARAATTTSS